MGRNTSISLGSHFEEFVNKKIGSGSYNSASEVIRAGLRLLEEREQKLEALRAALIEGENSGFVENFNSDQFLEYLNSKDQNG